MVRRGHSARSNSRLCRAVSLAARGEILHLSYAASIARATGFDDPMNR